jgi:HEAT repeat protein
MQKSRRIFWPTFGGVALTAAALLVPSSPLYLPNFFTREGFQGHSANHWIETLKRSEGDDRLEAIHAVGALGADAGDAVPVLAEILREDPDRAARSQAAFALSKMAPASRGAVAELAAALKDTEPRVRMNAASALFRLGLDADEAVPALIEAVKDKSNQGNAEIFHITIQGMATLALGRAGAGNRKAADALMEVLKNARTVDMRIDAARALGEVGEVARRAAPLLRPLTEDANDEVRRAARQALELIGAGKGSA